MRSFLKYLQSKLVAKWSSTSEQEGFAEKDRKDAVKRLFYQDTSETQASFLLEVGVNVLLVANLTASVTNTWSLTSPGGFTYDNKDKKVLHVVESLLISMAWFSSLVLMLNLRRTVTCHGYGFSLWDLHWRTGMAMIGLTASFAIWSSRSVMSSIEFSACAATILLCSGLEFLEFLCKSLEKKCDHSIREPLIHCSNLLTAELQHHRDPALSGSQKSVPKWLKKLVELPADEDEHMKSKTEKEHKDLLVLAALVASLTYQVGLSRPGALWQESKSDHVVGNQELNDNHRRRFMAFGYLNADIFVSSLAIIQLLVTRKIFASGILSNVLSVCVIIGMLVLTGVFAAMSSRRASTYKYVFIHLFAVQVCIMLQVLVRVGSRFLAESSVLGHKNNNMKRHLLLCASLAAMALFYCSAKAFVASVVLLTLLLSNKWRTRGIKYYALQAAVTNLDQGHFGPVYAPGNCSESSADPAADGEDDDDCANRPTKRNNPREATGWLLSCAAAHHITGNQSLLLTGGNIIPLNDGNFVQPANGDGVPLRVQGSGSVRTEKMALDDVWYVPGLDSNLVSTAQLARQGCAIALGLGGCRITRGGDLVGTARFTETSLFELDFLKVDAASSM